jgi:hypothetical protein
MSAREEFLAGDRLDDVLVYLAETAVSKPEALAEHAERVADGLVLVMPGDEARAVFQEAAGIDPMAFAREAGGTEGDVAADLTGATCPDAPGDGGVSGDGDDSGIGDGGDGENPEDGDDADDPADAHDVRFVFAFAEAENQDAGGLYAEGDVVHAYVSCACGTAYSDRWVAGSR